MFSPRPAFLFAIVFACTGHRVADAGTPCQDLYDPNESCAVGAPEIGAGTFSALQAAGFTDSADADWYRVFLRRSERLTARATFAVAPGDAEIDLLTDDCITVLTGERSGGNLVHSIEYVNDGPDAYFKIVTGHYDLATCHTYELAIGIEGTGNLDNTVMYPGWSAPVVPRDDTGASLPSASVTPTLNGNAAATWFSWSVRQTGPVPLPQWTTRLQVDAEFVGPVFSSPSPALPLDYYTLNQGPFLVRGGRHTVTSRSDPDGLAAETNELDNTYDAQHVWSPFVTAWGNPILRSLPPDPGLLVLPNGDGFSFTRNPNYAWVVALAARDPEDDYDVAVYDDYSGSNAGFSNLRGLSSFATNATDFVVGHFSGTPATVYPAALRFAAGAGGAFMIDQIDARFRNGPVLDGPASFTGQILSADRLADVFEAYMNAGSTFYLTLHRVAGEADLSFEVFPGSPDGIHARGSGTAATALSADTDVLTFVASVTGWHPIVVHRDNGTGADAPVPYDFHWSKTGFVGTTETPVTAGFAFPGPRPNPIAGAGRFTFVVPRAGRASLALFDTGGRRVRELADRTFEAGAHDVAWDGRADDGGRLPAGVYWAAVRFENRSLTARVVVL